MTVVVKEHVHTTSQEVDARKYDVWMSISLGNKFFNNDNIKEYLVWALAHTKQDVCLLVVDTLQRFNYQILNKKSIERAYKIAINKGDEKKREIEEVLETFSEQDRKKVHIISWDEIESDAYETDLQIVRKEFETNTEFRNEIREIVKEGRPDRAETIAKLSNEKLDVLCEYILRELPLLFKGVYIPHTDKHYQLFMYPGVGRLDELWMAIHNGTKFVSLRERLSPPFKNTMVSAFVE